MAKGNELLKQAIQELGIDVPVMATRTVGNKLEIRLYGGARLIWPSGAAEIAAAAQDPAPQKVAKAPAKRSRIAKT